MPMLDSNSDLNLPLCCFSRFQGFQQFRVFKGFQRFLGYTLVLEFKLFDCFEGLQGFKYFQDNNSYNASAGFDNWFEFATLLFLMVTRVSRVSSV